MSKTFLQLMVAVLVVALALSMTLALGYDRLNTQLLNAVDDVLEYCLQKQ